MSDRYYDERPVQGSGNRSTQRPAGSGAQPTRRPAGYGETASRPAQSGGQPVRRTSSQPGAQPTRRPAGYGESTARPAQSSAQPVRRTASQPGAQTTRRPAGYGESTARPAQSGGQPVRRTASQPGAQTTRHPAGYGETSSRPVRSGASSSSAARRPAGSSARPSSSGKRPAQNARRSPSKKRRSSSGGVLSFLPPTTRWICGVLCVAILITVCLAVTSKIRSGRPQPTITSNTAVPAQMQTETPTQIEQPTDEPIATDEPIQTDAPAVTDEPVATDAPVATDEPVQQTTSGSRTARIRAIGDVIIDETMLENGEISDDVYDFSPLFELVGDVMADADWTMINIEASLRKHKYGYMGFPQFSTPHSILEDLKEVGVDMLTMCNNHALDGYYDGLKMSLDYADAAGLAHVGAYRSQKEYDTPEIYDINGIKVGMLNYTQYTNGMAEKSDKEATIYGMRLMQGADYEGDIAKLKAAGAEFVITIMHWGEEYMRQPENATVSVSRRLVAAGADLVIGGHPHVVQPAQYVTETMADGTNNTALVVYSIGNFVSEHRHESMAYTDNGVIFDFTLQENAAGEIELVDPNVIPIYMWQISNGGNYQYRAVASGDYLDSPIEGMNNSQYERMKASYREIEALMGGVIPVRAH